VWEAGLNWEKVGLGRKGVPACFARGFGGAWPQAAVVAELHESKKRGRQRAVVVVGMR
jgi:hypothetical protein